MDIVDRIKGVGRSVAVKSGEIAESGKLTINIRKKEKEIRSLELKIGQMVYNAYKNGHTFEEEISEECRNIDAAYADITRLEAEKSKVGLEDLGVEVVDVDTEISEDEEFEVSEEEDEILREL